MPRLRGLSLAPIEACGIHVVVQAADPRVDVEAARRRPRQLRIDLVEERREGGRRHVVVDVACRLGRRQIGQEPLRHRAEAVRRNVVARRESRVGGGRQPWAVGKRKRRPPRSVHVAGQRVIDRDAGAGEVSGPELGGRQRQQQGGRSDERPANRPRVRGLDTGEVEELVALDWPADRAAVDVFRPLRLVAGGRQEEVPRAEIRMLEVFECRTAQRIRAALDLHVHGGAAGHPLVRFEVARHDVHGFDRLDSGTVGLKAGNPLIGHGHAVEPERRIGVGCPFTETCIERDGLLMPPTWKYDRLRHTGSERQQALIASPVDREILEGLSRRHRLQRRAVGLQDRRLARDDDGLFEGSEREPRIDANDRADVDGDVAARKCPEAGQRHDDVIGAWREIGK